MARGTLGGNGFFRQKVCFKKYFWFLGEQKFGLFTKKFGTFSKAGFCVCSQLFRGSKNFVGKKNYSIVCLRKTNQTFFVFFGKKSIQACQNGNIRVQKIFTMKFKYFWEKKWFFSIISNIKQETFFWLKPFVRIVKIAFKASRRRLEFLSVFFKRYSQTWIHWLGTSDEKTFGTFVKMVF